MSVEWPAAGPLLLSWDGFSKQGNKLALSSFLWIVPQQPVSCWQVSFLQIALKAPEFVLPEEQLHIPSPKHFWLTLKSVLLMYSNTRAGVFDWKREQFNLITLCSSPFS